MPHPQHESVRQAFGRRCAYCGVLEDSAGAELTVDHYQPRSASGTDEIGNLVYACHRCNLYKGFYWPTPDEIAAGEYILHPHRHEISDHIRENAITGRLEPLTATGAFNIRLLHLNRPQLIAHRLERRAAEIRTSRLQLLEEQIAQQEQTIQFLHGYNDFLIRLLSSTAPPEE